MIDNLKSHAKWYFCVQVEMSFVLRKMIICDIAFLCCIMYVHALSFRNRYWFSIQAVRIKKKPSTEI